jgi:hypothetical protein
MEFKPNAGDDYLFKQCSAKLNTIQTPDFQMRHCVAEPSAVLSPWNIEFLTLYLGIIFEVALVISYRRYKKSQKVIIY